MLCLIGRGGPGIVLASHFAGRAGRKPTRRPRNNPILDGHSARVRTLKDILHLLDLLGKLARLLEALHVLVRLNDILAQLDHRVFEVVYAGLRLQVGVGEELVVVRLDDLVAGAAEEGTVRGVGGLPILDGLGERGDEELVDALEVAVVEDLKQVALIADVFGGEGAGAVEDVFLGGAVDVCPLEGRLVGVGGGGVFGGLALAFVL
jgi:CBS domain-containing protein